MEDGSECGTGVSRGVSIEKFKCNIVVGRQKVRFRERNKYA